MIKEDLYFVCDDFMSNNSKISTNYVIIDFFKECLEGFTKVVPPIKDSEQENLFLIGYFKECSIYLDTDLFSDSLFLKSLLNDNSLDLLTLVDESFFDEFYD